MRRVFPLFLLIAFLLPVMGAVTEAQTHSGASGVSKTLLNSSVYAGYSFLTQDLRGGTGLNGWELAYTRAESLGLRFKADVFSYSGADGGAPERPMYFMVGQEAGLGAGGIRIFAHGLIGVGHTYGDWYYGPGATGGNHASTNTLAADFGGGLDKTLAGPMAWRFEGDYLYSNFTVSDNQVHGLPSQYVRLSTGLVLRF